MKDKKKKEKRKNIDLPEVTIGALAKKANVARMPIKNYMEKVLIDHAKIVD